jgi:hypothetical protein
MDRDDVGMLQAAGVTSLPEKALRVDRSVQLRPQNFDGEGPVEPRIASAEDETHPARPEHPLDVDLGG